MGNYCDILNKKKVIHRKTNLSHPSSKNSKNISRYSVTGKLILSSDLLT